MWTLLAFISALCLGCYDVSKKIALRSHTVTDVLTISICISAVILSVPWLLSLFAPEVMMGTPFFVPQLDGKGHLLTLLKSVLVLSSWIFAYISLKYLPISLVSPMQATRPMWTLIGALLLFDEHLNSWQWAGVLLAIGTIFIFSFQQRATIRKQPVSGDGKAGRYYLCLALAILIGACCGLYDKYLMRRYDHNAVQVYYTFYQAILMLAVWLIARAREHASSTPHPTLRFSLRSMLPIVLISVFLVISDNVYMLALRDPDAMIAVVSTIRRGGTLIGFAYGLIFLREPDPWRKLLCMLGIATALVCLAIGAA